MLGRNKDTDKSAKPVPSTEQVAHTFDQTNGVMREFDLYQSRLRGESTALDYDSDEQKDKLFRSGAIGGMLGKT